VGKSSGLANKEMKAKEMLEDGCPSERRGPRQWGKLTGLPKTLTHRTLVAVTDVTTSGNNKRNRGAWTYKH
jgi:hypothetical protein